MDRLCVADEEHVQPPHPLDSQRILKRILHGDQSATAPESAMPVANE